MRAAFLPLLLALAAFGTGNSPAWAGSQYVIIAAEPAAAGLEPGKVLKLDDTLTVPEGVTVTLLGEDGSVSAIPGPASVTVTDDGVGAAASEEKRSALSKVAGLLAGENKTAQALGVARSMTDKAGAARIDPWAVSFARDGNACARGNAVALGREVAQLSMSIAVEAAGNRSELNWPAGQSVLALPEATVAAAEEIEVTASGRKVLLRLHRLPEQVSETDTLALLGWFIDQGCDGQALALARKLAAEAK